MSKCDNCGVDIQEFENELVGGKCLKFVEGDEEYYVIRCDNCFETDKSLRNYKKTEVYSRVVGYIRPVQQWHKGKQQEWKERVEFKNPLS